MTTIAIRQKLSNYLQVADDKEVKKMYALLKDEIVLEERITIEQYNKEIDEAEAEYERGDFISHEEMEKIASKW
jgi:predicted transcriptional regulator